MLQLARQLKKMRLLTAEKKIASPRCGCKADAAPFQRVQLPAHWVTHTTRLGMKLSLMLIVAAEDPAAKIASRLLGSVPGNYSKTEKA
jgi:hypothetical protein